MAVGRPFGTGMKSLAGGALLALTLAACGGEATPTTGTTGAPASIAPTAVSAASAAPSAAASAAPSSAATVATRGTAAAAPASAAPATMTRSATGTTGGASTATAGRASATATSGTTYAIVAANSKATYKVDETFINQGNRFATAEGSTSAITGNITIDKQNPARSTIGTITTDISKLASDSGQRDNQIRNRWLESAKYPTATFVPKRLEGLPTTPYADGQELTFKIVGDLTIRTVTKEVTFDTKGKIVGDTFTGTAVTTFNMTDFGFDPPNIAGIVRSENGVELTMTIEAKGGQ